MKIAVSGKGGVGKTTLTALLAGALSLDAQSVIALDADPDANLGAALGIPPDEQPVPLSEMSDLIAERTGAKDNYGGYFKLNPKVDDIPETYAARIGHIRLLVLGGVSKGGGGCICPASTLVKALLQHLILGVDETVIMDMEAGIEHLGRATGQSMDAMIVVVRTSPWSIQTALRIRKLAGDLGVKNLFAVANHVKGQEDVEWIRRELDGIALIGQIPYDERFEHGVVRLTKAGQPAATEALDSHLDEVKTILSEVKKTI